ncbi:M23 family metallopeptidase [Streptomyces chattanoogensis]|uniref:Peptidase n=1 Tax=Streptomyces chattanoogensis TaxID=66876 RepID=A0A0N0GZK8_9ACTN|nr:M23 family metallopeptidase [Streptomyces chattanoogensis]KPC62841.1 peptidase [Streptomyces chattanoogensis]
MASNRPAPQAPSAADLDDWGPYDDRTARFDGPGVIGSGSVGSGSVGSGVVYEGGDGEGPWEEWNPTEESVRPVRGKHRVAKQRSGGLARSGTVLGVGVIAAVGAGGMATAEGRPPVPISVPDLGSMADDVAEKLPDAKSLPGIGGLISDDGSDSGPDAADSSSAPSGPLSQAGLTRYEAAQGANAGEALRNRILQQADAAQDAAEQERRDAEEAAAVARAAKDAAAQQQTAEKAAAAKKAAELEAKRKAEAAARKKAEAERLAELAKSFITPVASYTLTASFGQAGDRWAADHTGQDFAAPTGTPVRAVHSGTITQAGWAGAYGYRIVLTLDDGTELWFCHLSSMVKTSGKVNTGEVIGRVGATGNVTGPHLHLEVRPGAGDPIDPMPWLREHGLDV